MYILVYKQAQTLKLGLKTPVGVVDVAKAGEKLGFHPLTPADFYQQGLEALPTLQAIAQAELDPSWLLEEAKLELAPCVPNPSKIICVGLNYSLHVAESGRSTVTSPTLFSKFGSAVAASGEKVPLPKSAEQFDYEAELVVVIGKQGKYIPEAQALDYVLGYCNGNDLSARDLQNRTSQWLLGKTPDKFMPLGPYLVTAEEIPNPQTLDVRCWLNGDLRQNSNTANMIYPVAFLISYISQHMTLYPNDIISTGTPEGVILGREEKIWLKAGDEVVVEVGQLGRLTNKLIAEG